MKYHLLILSAVFLIRCTANEEEIEIMALQEYERLSSVYREEQRIACQLQLLQEAEVVVDSILLHRRFNPLSEFRYNPSIPKRPEFLATDSLIYLQDQKITPLIPEQDSNLRHR